MQLGEQDSPIDADDERWMQHALGLAQQADRDDEVPVGAVLVADGVIVGEGHNQPIGACDVSAHAEIIALREASQARGNYRLPNTTLYVTLEPCMMCAGALVHARVSRLVIGALEPKAGAVVSHRLMHSAWLNHQVETVSGVLQKDCAQLLQNFFAKRRADGRAQIGTLED